MGFWESCGQLATNVIGFGAPYRQRQWEKKWIKTKADVDEALASMKSKALTANRRIEALVATKTRTVQSLRRVRAISKNLNVRERDVREGKLNSLLVEPSFERVETTINGMEFTMYSIKGAGAGISTAMGAWALVGVCGTASTGTAISTLSGP